MVADKGLFEPMANRTTMFTAYLPKQDGETNRMVLFFGLFFVDESNLEQSNHREVSARNAFHLPQVREEAAKSMAAAEAEDLRGRYFSIGG